MSGIKSPCESNCCLDKDDVCIGCGRTLGEVTRWGGANDEEKRQILAAVLKRKASSVIDK